MLLQPINRIQYTNKYSQSALKEQNNNHSVPKNVMYKGATEAGNPIRQLRHVPCAFFGITTLSEQELKEIRGGIYGCNTVKKTLACLRKYKNRNMLPVEKKMFERLDAAAPYSSRIKFPVLLKDGIKRHL